MVRFIMLPNGEDVFIALKPAIISVRAGGNTVLTFDREGRLFSANISSCAYRRGLVNRILVKDRRQEAVREVQYLHLSGLDRYEFLQKVHQKISSLWTALQERSVQFWPGKEPPVHVFREVSSALERILAYDPARLEAEGRRFVSILRPPGMLPPDQSLAVVLQLTEGCSWNRCTYCTLYRDRPFRVKELEEFAAHIREVKAFLGEGLALRRSVFLGDGNAIVLPQDRLLRVLDLINEEFWIAAADPPDPSLPHFTGIYAFMDPFSPLTQSPLDFEQLARRGLRRVYIGVDTGQNGLLKFLGKPGSAEQAWRAICTVKEGGIRVGIIILLGAGGDLFYYSHVQETVNLLNALPLGEGDIIYFSPLVIHPGSAYADWTAEIGIRPISPAHLEEQREAIVQALRFTNPLRPPKLAPFDLRGFIY
jgi:radical SAM superfamily enzyme YgiQ (UPF0313 family)